MLSCIIDIIQSYFVTIFPRIYLDDDGILLIIKNKKRLVANPVESGCALLFPLSSAKPALFYIDILL